MTKSAVYGYSPFRSELTAYISDLIATGKPFMITKAVERLKSSHTAVLGALHRMEAAGTIVMETRRQGAVMHYRVGKPDGGKTPWPETEGFTPHRVSSDEIQARRHALEDEREAKRRYWLERERAPRWRDQPRDHLFLDKATVMALQGVSA